MSKDTHNELPSCIEDLESVIYYLPTEEDVDAMKYMEEEGNTEELNRKANKLLEYIETAQNALSNIIYFYNKRRRLKL